MHISHLAKKLWKTFNSIEKKVNSRRTFSTVSVGDTIENVFNVFPLSTFKCHWVRLAMQELGKNIK